MHVPPAAVTLLADALRAWAAAIPHRDEQALADAARDAQEALRLLWALPAFTDLLRDHQGIRPGITSGEIVTVLGAVLRASAGAAQLDLQPAEPRNTAGLIEAPSAFSATRA